MKNLALHVILEAPLKVSSKKFRVLYIYIVNGPTFKGQCFMENFFAYMCRIPQERVTKTALKQGEKNTCSLIGSRTTAQNVIPTSVHHNISIWPSNMTKMAEQHSPTCILPPVTFSYCNMPKFSMDIADLISKCKMYAFINETTFRNAYLMPISHNLQELSHPSTF